MNPVSYLNKTQYSSMILHSKTIYCCIKTFFFSAPMYYPSHVTTYVACVWVLTKLQYCSPIILVLVLHVPRTDATKLRASTQTGQTASLPLPFENYDPCLSYCINIFSLRNVLHFFHLGFNQINPEWIVEKFMKLVKPNSSYQKNNNDNNHWKYRLMKKIISCLKNFMLFIIWENDVTFCSSKKFWQLSSPT